MCHVMYQYCRQLHMQLAVTPTCFWTVMGEAVVWRDHVSCWRGLIIVRSCWVDPSKMAVQRIIVMDVAGT